MLTKVENLNISNPKGFVVLEGVNGAGKSTLQSRLADYVKKAGLEVVSTFEPGSTELGRELRRILLENAAGKLDPVTELFLFCADRREHVTRVILPALAAGKFVLSDRYFYSTTAFQGYGRQLPLSVIAGLHPLAVRDLYPDLVILLDLLPEVGLARNRERDTCMPERSNGDSFEREMLDFHERLRRGFLEMAEQRPEPFLVIDASQSQERVFEQSRRALDVVLRGLKT